uniref:Uncharacterized protein n=1 Tax=Entamoeba invadens TaxID=33085 RepID=S0AZX0_ENTIV|nr:hypothetical protein [Entamoeba invadens]
MADKPADKAEDRQFILQRPERKKQDDGKIYIGALPNIAQILYEISDLLEAKNKPCVVVRGLGRGATSTLRIMEIVQHTKPYHAVVKTDLFRGENVFVCEADKKEVKIPKLMTSVEVTFYMQKPENVKAEEYFAPLSDDQLEVFKNRPKRVPRRTAGYVRNGNRRFNDRREDRRNAPEKKEGKEEKPQKEEKQERQQEERREERPQEERRYKGSAYPRSGNSGYRNQRYDRPRYGGDRNNYGRYEGHYEK